MPCKPVSLRQPQPLLFATIVVCTVASKLLHVFQHLTTVPLSRFIIFFPTFLVQDVVVIAAARLLLSTSAAGLPAALGLGAGSFLTCVCL